MQRRVGKGGSHFGYGQESRLAICSEVDRSRLKSRNHHAVERADFGLIKQPDTTVTGCLGGFGVSLIQISLLHHASARRDLMTCSAV